MKYLWHVLVFYFPLMYFGMVDDFDVDVPPAPVVPTPSIPIYHAMGDKTQVFLANKWKTTSLIGGQTSLVLPRDAPTVVINQLPLQGFRLGTDYRKSDQTDDADIYHTHDRYLLDDVNPVI